MLPKSSENVSGGLLPHVNKYIHLHTASKVTGHNMVAATSREGRVYSYMRWWQSVLAKSIGRFLPYFNDCVNLHLKRMTSNLRQPADNLNPIITRVG